MANSAKDDNNQYQPLLNKEKEMKNRWTVKVEQEDTSNGYHITLPDELLEKMEWKVGDTLKLDIIKMGIDRSLHITKKDVTEGQK